MTFPKPSFSPAEPIAAEPLVKAAGRRPGRDPNLGLAEVAARRRHGGGGAPAAADPAGHPGRLAGAALDGYVGLPSPAQVWADSKDLILHPFFDHGGVDKGLFWHVLTSLKRVGSAFRSRWSAA
jgi:nitrate/nitrite transport system permease protein